MRRNGAYKFEEGLPQIVQRTRLIEKENPEQASVEEDFCTLNVPVHRVKTKSPLYCGLYKIAKQHEVF